MFLFVNPGSGGNKGKARAVVLGCFGRVQVRGSGVKTVAGFQPCLGALSFKVLMLQGSSGHELMFGSWDVGVSGRGFLSTASFWPGLWGLRFQSFNAAGHIAVLIAFG